MIKITWQNETYVIHQWKFFLNLLKISFCMLEITWKKETFEITQRVYFFNLLNVSFCMLEITCKKETFEIIIKNDVSAVSKLKNTKFFFT